MYHKYSIAHTIYNKENISKKIWFNFKKYYNGNLVQDFNYVIYNRTKIYISSNSFKWPKQKRRTLKDVLVHQNFKYICFSTTQYPFRISTSPHSFKFLLFTETCF